jgi:hypothetical protein
MIRKFSSANAFSPIRGVPAGALHISCSSPIGVMGGGHTFNFYPLVEGGVAWHRPTSTSSLFFVARVSC